MEGDMGMEGRRQIEGGKMEGQKDRGKEGGRRDARKREEE